MKQLILLFLLILTYSINANAQWVQAPNPENVRLGIGGYAQIGDTIFTGTKLISTFDGKLEALYKSGDEGLTWLKVNAESGLTNQNIDFLANVGVDSTLFLASIRYLQSSSDGGKTWDIDGDFQQGDERVPVHFVKQGNVIIGAVQGDTNDGADGVFRKIGNGEWEAANEGLPEGRDEEIAPQIFDMIISDDRILLTAGSDVYFSDDTAKTWARFTGYGTYINQLAAGNDLIIGSGFRSFNSYLYKSTNNGKNWDRITVQDELKTGIDNIHFSDGIFYASVNTSNADGGGIYISNDGENWQLLGLKGNRINAISSTENNILFEVFLSYNEGEERGTWIYPKSEVIITSNEIVENPSYFKLNQNYPNPFNPSTSISFELQNSEFIELEVFNMLGQKVATLINGYKSAGSHSITFNASNLSSGIYMYRLHSANATQTRKMLLVK